MYHAIGRGKHILCWRSATNKVHDGACHDIESHKGQGLQMNWVATCANGCRPPKKEGCKRDFKDYRSLCHLDGSAPF